MTPGPSLGPDPLPTPLGFGRCAKCAFNETGSAGICYRCARTVIADLPTPHCPVCGQGVVTGGSCANAWCHRSDRAWGIVWAISTKTGVLDQAIVKYKYSSKWAWALIFGRVIAGFLAEHQEQMASYGLVVPAPAFTGGGASRTWDHVDLMCAAAAVESTGTPPVVYSATAWPERAQRYISAADATDPVLTVNADVGSMVSTAGLSERRHLSDRKYEATSVTAPERVAGKRVLVVDDIFTTGSTLQAYARRLREAGAAGCDGLVLARSPWR